MKQPVTICFANNKGGSGKSTTCGNVGYFLARQGKRVLLVDGDMQLNLSLSFFSEEQVLQQAKGQRNLYHAVRTQQDLRGYILPTAYENLDLVPSSTLMSGIEYELFTKWQRELILRRCLQGVKDEGGYDYILLDAPPTLGGWVMNLLCAADYLLIPVEASPWGLFGLANLFEFLADVRQISPELQLLGIVVTKVNERKNYFRQSMEVLRGMQNVHTFDTYIRGDASIEWAQDANQPVGVFRPGCRSAAEYQALAKEVDFYVNKQTEN